MWNPQSKLLVSLLIQKRARLAEHLHLPPPPPTHRFCCCCFFLSQIKKVLCAFVWWVCLYVCMYVCMYAHRVHCDISGKPRPRLGFHSGHRHLQTGQWVWSAFTFTCPSAPPAEIALFVPGTREAHLVLSNKVRFLFSPLTEDFGALSPNPSVATGSVFRKLFFKLKMAAGDGSESMLWCVF